MLRMFYLTLLTASRSKGSSQNQRRSRTRAHTPPSDGQPPHAQRYPLGTSSWCGTQRKGGEVCCSSKRVGKASALLQAGCIERCCVAHAQAPKAEGYLQVWRTFDAKTRAASKSLRSLTTQALWFENQLLPSVISREWPQQTGRWQGEMKKCACEQKCTSRSTRARAALRAKQRNPGILRRVLHGVERAHRLGRQGADRAPRGAGGRLGGRGGGLAAGAPQGCGAKHTAPLDELGQGADAGWFQARIRARDCRDARLLGPGRLRGCRSGAVG